LSAAQRRLGPRRVRLLRLLIAERILVSCVVTPFSNAAKTDSLRGRPAETGRRKWFDMLRYGTRGAFWSRPF
jgi:hypothetical protein